MASNKSVAPSAKPANPGSGSDAAAKAGEKQGNTQTSIDQEPVPRLPHEQDQSADQQAGPLDPNVVQAGKDLKRGLVDTDKGAAMHETYKKQK